MHRSIHITLMMLMVTLLVLVSINCICYADVEKNISSIIDSRSDAIDSSDNSRSIVENVSRIDVENNIKDFQYKVEGMDFNYYKNTNALKNIIALRTEISNDNKAIEEWSDDVLLARMNLIMDNFPKLEIRQDKMQLKRTLDNMLSKDIPSDRRYKNKEIDKYNDLIDRANSMISNMDISEANVLKLDEEITKFTNKYKDYPWWTWLIYSVLAIIAVIVSTGIIISKKCEKFHKEGETNKQREQKSKEITRTFVVTMVVDIILNCIMIGMCGALALYTFISEWGTLMILIGIVIIVDGIITKIGINKIVKIKYH